MSPTVVLVFIGAIAVSECLPVDVTVETEADKVDLNDDFSIPVHDRTRETLFSGFGRFAHVWS